MACMCGGCNECLADQGWLPEDFEDNYNDEIADQKRQDRYEELMGMADAAYGVGDMLAGKAYTDLANKVWDE